MKTKNIFCVFLLFCVLSFCFYKYSDRDKEEENQDFTETFNETQTDNTSRINYENVKAMWLSQFDLCDVYKTDKNTFKSHISKIFANCKSIGINTVFVQVRPNGDSMYPSQYFTPSVYVTGEYGKDFNYDPFYIIVEEAHKYSLSVHAWINPMRAMKESEISLTESKYPLSKWWNDPNLKDLYLPVVDGRIYLNVAYPEVRDLIVDGAREILQNYDVDGLHMDDYFYPTTEKSFDFFAYSELGENMSLSDFRRNNVNLLISELYSTVKETDVNLLFGISPAGTLEKDYAELYADIYTWCELDGYIDYICPQLYFGFEHATCAFDKLCDKWDSIIKNHNVKLIIGISLGKAVNASNGIIDKWAGEPGKDEWMRHTDIILRSLTYTKTAENCVGVLFFSYQYFWDPKTHEENLDSKEERDNFLPLIKSIEWQD